MKKRNRFRKSTNVALATAVLAAGVVPAMVIGLDSVKADGATEIQSKAKGYHAFKKAAIKDLPRYSMIEFNNEAYWVLEPSTGYIMKADPIKTTPAKIYDSSGDPKFEPTKAGTLAHYLNNEYYNSMTAEAKAAIKSGQWGTSPLTYGDMTTSVSGEYKYKRTLENLRTLEQMTKVTAKIALPTLTDIIQYTTVEPQYRTSSLPLGGVKASSTFSATMTPDYGLNRKMIWTFGGTRTNQEYPTSANLGFTPTMYVDTSTQFTVYDYKYTIENGVLNITDYYGTSDEFIIPDVIDGQTVTTLSGVPEFTKSTRVILNESLKTIGKSAFYDKKVSHVEIPEGVETIGEGAFYNTQVTELNLPSTLKTIGVGAFNTTTKLTKINIPDGVTSIGDRAFKGSKITEIVIPNGITKLGDEVFSDTPLTTITLPEGLESIGASTFKNTKVTDIVIPNTVKSIGVSAFEGARLNTITLPTGITTISNSTFKNAVLGSITLPNTVKSIGVSAFEGATLPSITLPEGVETLSASAFKNVVLDSVRIPTTVKVWGTEVFAGSQLKSVDLPEGLTTLGVSAFKGSKLLEVEIPSTISALPVEVFMNTPLTKVTLLSSVKTIGDRAFSNTKLTNVVIPEGVDTLGVEAFNSSAPTLENVYVLNKYIRYVSSNLNTIAITNTGKVFGHEGSTTQSIYALNGFRPLSESVKQPIIVSSNIVNGQTYEGVVKPKFTFADAENVVYTLNGSPYDGVSDITNLGENTLTVTLTNGVLTTTKTYKFNIVEGTTPPEEETDPTKAKVWSFGNPDVPFTSAILPITVLGGKPITNGITIRNVDWVEKETTVTTSHGDIVLTPDGKGNTVVTIPNGLTEVSQETYVPVEYNGVNFLDLKIQAKPKVDFKFNF